MVEHCECFALMWCSCDLAVLKDSLHCEHAYFLEDVPGTIKKNCLNKYLVNHDKPYTFPRNAFCMEKVSETPLITLKIVFKHFTVNLYDWTALIPTNKKKHVKCLEQ